MNAKVEDPMGLEAGIRIDMVRTVLDKTKGNIIIHGRNDCLHKIGGVAGCRTGCGMCYY